MAVQRVLVLAPHTDDGEFGYLPVFHDIYQDHHGHRFRRPVRRMTTGWRGTHTASHTAAAIFAAAVRNRMGHTERQEPGATAAGQAGRQDDCRGVLQGDPVAGGLEAPVCG